MYTHICAWLSRCLDRRMSSCIYSMYIHIPYHITYTILQINAYICMNFSMSWHRHEFLYPPPPPLPSPPPLPPPPPPPHDTWPGRRSSMGRCSISGASSTTLAGRRTAGKGRASKLSLLLSLFFLATCQKLSLLPFFYLFSFFGCLVLPHVERLSLVPSLSLPLPFPFLHPSTTHLCACTARARPHVDILFVFLWYTPCACVHAFRV